MFSEPDSSTIKSTFPQYKEGWNGCKVEDILDSKKEASLCNTQSGMDEINLLKLTFQPTLAGIVLRIHRQTIKKQVNNVTTKMSWEEREELTSQLGNNNQMEEDRHHFIFCNT